MKAKQIASILGIAEEEKKELLALLKKLEQDGKVQKMIKIDIRFMKKHC